MKTIKIAPRGYCHGVVDAIRVVSNLDHSKYKKPIYILGMVIHNQMVVDALNKDGVITLHDPSKTRMELLEEIQDGTVIFTAHGISPQVMQRAIEKGLDIVDTTCTDVTKGQTVLLELVADDYDVIYIGKHNHPESEAAGSLSEKIHVIETLEDLERLDITSDRLAITNQTTMSIYDVYHISQAALTKYPHIRILDESCDATRMRQEAISKQDGTIDHCFVVGDKLSNNSVKLVQVSKNQAGVDATLIQSVEDIDIEKLKTYNSVSVSSGASTPTRITNEVIAFLQQFDKDNPVTYDTTSKLTLDTLLPRKK